mmetsp:Transcript_2540/g.4924  ORF Transcript_2540/g.4924 Transcript_2540/m.4924 type:complete len:236 (+) Transcript_2540:140-847(+)
MRSLVRGTRSRSSGSAATGNVRLTLSGFRRGVASGVPDFGSTSYWRDSAFQKGGVREWFVDTKAVLPSIVKEIQYEFPELSTLKVAHLGSGLSLLGAELAQRLDTAEVANIDCSQEALLRLKAHISGLKDFDKVEKRLSFVCENLLEPSLLVDSVFQVCVDKGTLDAFEVGRCEATYLDSVARILTPGGLFIQVSDRPPEARDYLLLPGKQWSRATWASLEAEDLFLYRLTRSGD